MAELGQEAHTTGYILSGETLEGFGALDDASQRLKLKFTTLKNEIEKQFLPVLLDLGDDTNDTLTDITNAMKKPDGSAKKLAEAMKDIICFVSKLASVVLPPLIDILAFVADNLGVLLTVVIANVAALKTFAIVQAITGQYPHIWTHAVELTCPYWVFTIWTILHKRIRLSRSGFTVS